MGLTRQPGKLRISDINFGFISPDSNKAARHTNHPSHIATNSNEDMHMYRYCVVLDDELASIVLHIADKFIVVREITAHRVNVYLHLGARFFKYRSMPQPTPVSALSDRVETS